MWLAKNFQKIRFNLGWLSFLTPCSLYFSAIFLFNYHCQLVKGQLKQKYVEAAAACFYGPALLPSYISFAGIVCIRNVVVLDVN